MYDPMLSFSNRRAGHPRKVQFEGHQAAWHVQLYIGCMVLGTGMDLVSVPRVGKFVQRFQQRGLARLFTSSEVEYCLGLAHPLPSLAARFAAKEAFYKAIGTGFGRAGGWRDVEVVRLGSGRPLLCLHGRAAAVAQSLQVRKIHLSLTHTDEIAAATVVLEG
jgi:holo-[acyl-carrier protein] synthase